MTYTLRYDAAVALFKQGDFEASLHQFRDLLHETSRLTTLQHFELLNYVTNCQMNLDMFEAAYEHLEMLNTLAEQLQTPETLYYTAMKRAILAEQSNIGDSDALFSRVFAYARQTGKLAHICDTTGNCLYFLLLKKRYDEALAILEENMPAYEAILNEAPLSMRTLFPSAAETYFHCKEYTKLETLVSFYEIHMDNPILQAFHEIYYEMKRYVAIYKRDRPLFIEMIEREMAWFTMHDDFEGMIGMLQKNVDFCKDNGYVHIGISLAEKLLKVYQDRGVSNHKAKLAEQKGYVNLKRAAIHDQLTGLYNRRFLQSYEAPDTFSVAFFDIDCFKQINDTYGHKAGDIVLQRVGKILQSLCPSYVKAVRYGGDEFNLLIEASNEVASAFIDELFLAIKTLYINTNKGGFTVQISMGFAVKEATEDVDAVLMRADEALYMSKNNGRNQLVKSRC